jgi:NADH dehydrogenase
MSTLYKERYDALDYPKVVVVGGGFAGLKLIQKLQGQPYKVLLVDKHNHHCFQPLLYQVATAALTPDNIAHPFRATIAPMANVAFRMAEVKMVLPDEKKLIISNGVVIAYDILIIATGTHTNFFGNTELEENCMSLKSISEALDIRSDFLQEFEQAIQLIDEVDKTQQQKHLNFVVVGGGPTGVELAGALAEIRKNVLRNEYRELESEHMQILLIQSGGALLKNFSEKAQSAAKRYLEDLGVDVRLNKRVQDYDGETILFDDGSTMLSTTVIWAAGVCGSLLKGLEQCGSTRSGRYDVDRFNKLQGVDNIYALGDVALMHEGEWTHGHPQVAPVAIAQAEQLAANLKAMATGREMKPFSYVHQGQMATVGRKKAVVDIGKYTFGGLFAWLVWMFVHLMQLVNFRNRFMVLMNWAWKYISWRNTVRLIIKPFIPKSSMWKAFGES